MSDHLIEASYQFTQTLSSANTSRIVGPPGKRGKVTSLGVLCTTGLTGSEGLLQVGNSADADAYATLTLPNTSVNNAVAGTLTWTWGDGGTFPGIDPDTVIELTNDATPTAGAGIIFITIEWEK